FFFQAEDGIRDRNVTGVQTCALPIFQPQAVSPKGAQGLMQLMPATARDLGVADPFDPAANLDGGSRYLSSLVARYDGDLTKALRSEERRVGKEGRTRWAARDGV